jgi:hypothetical protein
MFLNPIKTIKPKKFEYKFRYYKSEQDQDKGKRVEFRRIRSSQRTAGGSLLRLFIMIILIVVVFIYLGKKGGYKTLKNTPKTEPIKVEEVVVVD